MRIRHRFWPLVALALLLGACGMAAAARPRPVAGRPLLVFVHGRGHLDRDSSAVRIEWERALRMGARELETGALFDGRDVRLVWYADVLDPASGEGCRRLDDPAQTTREEDASAFGGARALLGVLAAALDEPKGRREMRGLLGDLLYLADPWKRCGVERRLAATLREASEAKRPVVLVTHSLGAAVAYRYLRDRDGDAPVVLRWVTLGAPLGDSQLRALLLGEQEAALRVPASVRSWINVVRDGDPFAAALAPLLPSGKGRLTDLLRRAPTGDPHELSNYLRDDETARAIVWAWCDAFGAGGRPAGCRKVTRDAGERATKN